MEDKILWFIDDDDDERDTYYRELRDFITGNITIAPITPYPTLEKSLVILNDTRTIGIIVDQRLKETGAANYNGIHLAAYFRGINKKIPIYILTNYSENNDEFAGAEWNVEEIIPKGVFLKGEDERLIVTARLARHLNIYTDILDERTKRFNELLKKTLDNQLTMDEINELNDLRFERSAPILEIENRRTIELKQSIESNRQLMDLLKKFQIKDTE